MKKNLFLVVGVLCFFTSVHITHAQFAGGTGTEQDPYQIATCEQLQDIDSNLAADYVLVNNIDCSATSGWNINLDEWVDGDADNPLIPDPYTGVTNNGYKGFSPIGAADQNLVGFTGTFDGGEYTISDLWIFRKNEGFVGLFAMTTEGTIKNVRLLDANIVGSLNTGGLVGAGFEAIIENVIVESSMVRAYLSQNGGGIAGTLSYSSSIDNAEVIGGFVHGSGNVIGGLVGNMDSGTVTNSDTSAAIDGGESIGGAFGSLYNVTVTNVTATGDVVSNSSENQFVFIVKSGDFTGGFAGEVTGGTIADSSATGMVTAEGNYSGGFAGKIADATVSNSFATGVVSGVSLVGGFAGELLNAQLTDVYSTGLVTASGNNAGGFAGQSLCGTTITRAYALGNVTASQGNSVGGFAGFDGCEGPGTSYSQVFAAGSVTGVNKVGGFVGESYVSDFINVYAGGDVSGAEEVGGFGGYVYYGDIGNAYARGSVTASTSTNIGGFIGIYFEGQNDDTIKNSFWDVESSGQLTACGDGACGLVTGLETADAQTATPYTGAGWNFTTIWTIDTTNDGYPYFQVYIPGEDDVTAPVLTVVTPISSQTTIDQAVLTFSSTEACTVLAEEPYASIGSVELIMSEVTGTGTSTARLTGIQVGGTYSFRFLCEDTNGNSSNIIDSGSFTIISSTVVSSGGGRPWTPTTSTSTSGSQSSMNGSNGTAPASKPALCSADQLLTQNLRAGARDGRFHPYTRGIVKEVKILQAHMNRLGFNSGVVDGILGRITDGAIKRMQTYLGTTPDGLVGPKTRALINNSCGDKGLIR